MPKLNPVPEGLHTLTAQLTVQGAAEAIEFYKRAFGAEERSLMADPTGKKLLHAELRIGDSCLFINDDFPEMGGAAHPSSLWLYTADADALFKRATDAGAKVIWPMTDQFWGDRTGTLADRWGNRWNLAVRVKDMTQAEMEQAGAAFVAAMKQKR